MPHYTGGIYIYKSDNSATDPWTGSLVKVIHDWKKNIYILVFGNDWKKASPVYGFYYFVGPLERMTSRLYFSASPQKMINSVRAGIHLLVEK